MNLVLARRKIILKKSIKIAVIVILFLNVSAFNKSDNPNEVQIKMEQVTVNFEPLNKKICFSILKQDYVLEFINSNKGQIDDKLSSRFNSKVYKFQGEKLLEIRKLGMVEDCKLYSNLSDLLFCRNVFTVIRHDTKQRIYDVQCSENDINYLVAKYDGVPDPKLKEDTRVAIKLNNGQYIIVYRTGDGVLFNSLADLQYISPFDSFNDDYEDMFISRETNLYCANGLKTKVTVLEKDSALKLKISSDKTKNGSGVVLADGKILDKVNDQVYVLFSSKTEFEKLVSNRVLNRFHSEVIITNGKEDGLITKPDDFLKHTETAKKILAERLNIQIALLDGSIESLNLLDAEINKYLTDKYFVSELSLSIVGYIGEVLINSSNGVWSFKKYEPTKYYRAFIQSQVGNEIDFISAIFSEFQNQISTGDFASYAVVSGMTISNER